MVVSHQPADNIKPELTSVKLPPIRQATPEHRYNYSSSSVSNYDSDVSRRPSVSSIASSGFHPSRSASPAFSTCTLEPQYGAARPLDRLRLQAGHFPYTTTTHESTAAVAHTGGKASKKKREDRKRYSKRADTGTASSKVQKSDNEAGNRYMQALDQAELARVLREANPNIENTAAPRHGSSGGWTTLKNNNIAWDVRQDGIEPSLWNKSCINGSAIVQLRQSNEQFADSKSFFGMVLKQRGRISDDKIFEQIEQYMQCQAAAVSTRGEAHWKIASERMVQEL
ncbi:hypothetical protein E8E11_005700 [Didymella keratinophila]|nr:hypothetical protein E8E11_005700 [Didymella keratinophila]